MYRVSFDSVCPSSHRIGSVSGGREQNVSTMTGAKDGTNKKEKEDRGRCKEMERKIIIIIIIIKKKKSKRRNSSNAKCKNIGYKYAP